MRKIIVLLFLFAGLSAFSGCASTAPPPREAGPETMQASTPVQPAEYFLGVGDSLDITVYRNDDLKTSTKINPTGRIMFPLIGEVQAAGKTITALREDLRERFSKYLVDPQVSISVTAIQSQKVIVLGEVRTPGVYSLDSELTVMDAVARAGGWTNDAKMDTVLLLRNVSGKVETRPVDMAAGMKNGNFSENGLLQKNDVIYVPTKKIANVARFMTYIGNILSPIVLAEGGIVLFPQMIDALNGKKTGSSLISTP